MPSLILANGAKLAFTESGTGTPLVLVHGSPGEGRAWGRVARHLPDHRLLMPDLLGYGGSDPLPPGATTAARAEAVVALIDAAGAPVWLAAHSYGGNVALHAALARRERVKGLALFEPVFFRALALTGAHDVLAAGRAHFDDYVRRVEAGDNGAVSRMIAFWFGDGAFQRLPPPVQAYLTGAAPKNAADVKATWGESIAKDELAAFAPPTLIAYGAGSPPVAPAIAAALARLLPNAETVPIEGATHAMLDTHPEAVATLIKRMATP